MLAVVICGNYILYKTAPSKYYDIEIALTRIPVFLVGIYCGKKVKEDHVFTYKEAVLLFVLFGSKIFLNMYGKDGAYTRYWYIVHVWIRVIVKKFEYIYSVLGYDLNKYNVLNFLICTAISFGVTWLAVALEKKTIFQSLK